MSTPSILDEMREVATLVEELLPAVNGRSRFVAGATLADLVASWIASHYVPDDKPETRKVREELLKEHIRMVRHLMGVNAKMIGTDT